MDKMMVLKCLMLLFPAVIFLQSGLDKLFKMEGNKTYILSVFKKTFLKPISGTLFYLLMILELACGMMAITGFFTLVSRDDETIGYFTFLLSVITLTGLLAGQRIACDYAGAAGIIPYLILAFLGLYLFSV
ncbi:MAG: DoxX family membrane protein [Bacteroidetes bacterium]|nr:DoxX family membrane protein [Bacteroidota bacterium]